jgi:hypothetical protein
MQAPPKFQRGEQIHTLLRLTSVCSLFRSPAGQAFASVPQGPLARNSYPLNSSGFRAWMIDAFHDDCGIPPTPNAVNSVLQALHAKAQFGPIAEAATGPRIVPGPDSIALDLADPNALCIEISKQGWQPADGLNFAFQRNPGTGALPPPETAPDTQSIHRLRDLLNIPAGAPWTRILTWLTAALRPEGPYPILILRGSSGAGKSTTARLLRSLLDPTQTPLETLSAAPQQLEAAASRHRILACDDVDCIPRSIISTLSKIADHGAPVLLVLASHFTGNIPENIAHRGLIVDLAPPQNVRTLFALRREFESLHPHILGTLCSAASAALCGFEAAAESTYSRLADATAWACAAASALHLTAAEIRAAVALTPDIPEPIVPPKAVSTRAKHKTAARSAPSPVPLRSPESSGGRSGLH